VATGDEWHYNAIATHADPQAARDRKNGYYAKNLAKPVGLTRCPNPACGRDTKAQKVTYENADGY
jgi:hypothetical protein